MFDNLFQKYRNNKEYIQELNKSIGKLRDLRNPDWDKYDTNWFTAHQVNSEDAFTTSGYLEELCEFGIVESKNSPGTQIKIYKLKPQHYNINLVTQLDNWLNSQVENTQTNIVENITNSTVIKNSELHHSSVSQDIIKQNPLIIPSIPTNFQTEQDNKPTKNWQIIGIVIALLSLIFLILKHY